MKKWVCNTNVNHVFDSPTEDRRCPSCLNRKGILIETEIDQSPEQYNPAEKPIISDFATSKTKVKNEEIFTLSWDIENADKIELHKNDGLIKLNIDRNSIDLRDYFDDKKKESSYVLVAYNKGNETKSNPIIISLFVSDDSDKKPLIKQFYPDKTKVKNEESFTLSWDVENADKIELYKNNVLIKLDPDQKSIVLRDYFDNDRKESSYILLAFNNGKETKSNPIIISWYEIIDPPEKPVIRYFRASKVEVTSDERIILSWDVDNTDKIELYKDGALFGKLNNEQKSIEVKAGFFDNKKESSYTLVAYNKGEKTEMVIVLQKSKTPAPSIITQLLLLFAENKKFVKTALVLFAALVAFFIVYKLIAPKRSEFSVNERIIHEGSDITIRTQKLRDTTGLHVLFNSTEGQKTAFANALMSVKVPHIVSLSPDDLINVSIFRDANLLYQTKLIYVPNSSPKIDTTNNQAAHRDQGTGPETVTPSRVRRHRRILSVKYNLLNYVHEASWSQLASKPQEKPVNRILHWLDILQNGGPGAKRSTMEDGKSYDMVLQILPVNDGAGNYSVTGLFTFHNLTGKKTFKATVGFLSGYGNYAVEFEIWATDNTGQLVLIGKYSKRYDNTLRTINLPLPLSTSVNFKIQLVITGSKSSIASAGWIDPVVTNTPK